MFFKKKKSSYILDSFEKAKNWIESNTIDGGIIHSSLLRKPYPEVTGYYIPSLLKWGEKDLALKYGDWLVSIQTPEGAWQEVELKTIYTFDTGQILKGLYELIPCGEKYEKAFSRGCDWLLSQIDEKGRIHTPTTMHFSNIGNEYIHLYALEPLKFAAAKYDRDDYLKGIDRALKYYLGQKDLTDFNMLTHFHAYIIEALIDFGHKKRALQGLDLVKKYQQSSGAIPAFPNVRWVCLTALLQYAVCYYKLGMLEEGNKLLDHAISKQNLSGGFYGGSGWFVSYFKKNEISWAVKYLLDAIHLRLKLEFAKTERAESFHLSLDQKDQRYMLLSETIQFLSSEKHPIHLLDVGCGKGRFIHNLLSDGFQIDITAMDISDELFTYLPSECHKKVGNICCMPFNDQHYDVVFCCEVIEHAVNIEAAVKELSRVCKSDGVVIILDKDLSRKKDTRLESWEQWFDKKKLSDLMEKNGLRVEIKELLTTDGPPICAWIGKKTSNA